MYECNNKHLIFHQPYNLFTFGVSLIMLILFDFPNSNFTHLSLQISLLFIPHKHIRMSANVYLYYVYPVDTNNVVNNMRISFSKQGN